MRTNIVLDDELVAEAMQAAGTKTKRATVELALRHFVESCRRREALRRLKELRGADLIDPGYDVIAERHSTQPRGSD